MFTFDLFITKEENLQFNTNLILTYTMILQLILIDLYKCLIKQINGYGCNISIMPIE